MAEHTVRKGQDILDVAIEKFGSAEFFYDVVTDNALTVTSGLSSNQVLQIANEEAGIVQNKSFFRLNRISVVNADEALLQGGGNSNTSFSNDFSNDFG